MFVKYKSDGDDDDDHDDDDHGDHDDDHYDDHDGDGDSQWYSCVCGWSTRLLLYLQGGYY